MEISLNNRVGRPRKPGTLKQVIQRKKASARKRVRYALKIGKIVRPKFCDFGICVNEKLEAHHSDYDYPLAVVWLCKYHHVELHRSLKYDIIK